jgi:cell division protein FtsQ
MSGGAGTVAGRKAAGTPSLRRPARLASARRLLARVRARLPTLSPRMRRRLLAVAVLCLALATVYQFWFRDSGFVAVDEVNVSGLTTDEAPRIRAALTTAARSMTTLHLDRERLERAVEAYPVVRGIELSPDFPHGLTIRVIEHHPAAIAITDGGRVPVAGDGTVLRALPVEGRLPTIKADGMLRGERLEDPAALRAARIAGSAPAALRGRLERVERRREEGLVATLRDGPELIFGDATKIRAKWTAAARVLADKAAAGASYVDLRLPGRPAAGGLPAETVAPVAPAGATDSTMPGAGTYTPGVTDTAPDAATYTAPGAATAGASVPGTTSPATPTDAAPVTDPSAAAPVTGTPPSTTAPTESPLSTPPTDATGAGAAAAPSP